MHSRKCLSRHKWFDFRNKNPSQLVPIPVNILLTLECTSSHINASDKREWITLSDPSRSRLNVFSFRWPYMSGIRPCLLCVYHDFRSIILARERWKPDRGVPRRALTGILVISSICRSPFILSSSSLSLEIQLTPEQPALEPWGPIPALPKRRSQCSLLGLVNDNKWRSKRLPQCPQTIRGVGGRLRALKYVTNALFQQLNWFWDD